jgi:hypothetical protein
MSESKWQDISTAPKDGTTVWVVFRADIYPARAPDREDLVRWHGVQLPVRHEGTTPSGYDLGWSIAAPVGHGGFPDNWIAGWQPLPEPPEATP